MKKNFGCKVNSSGGTAALSEPDRFVRILTIPSFHLPCICQTRSDSQDPLQALVISCAALALCRPAPCQQQFGFDLQLSLHLLLLQFRRTSRVIWKCSIELRSLIHVVREISSAYCAVDVMENCCLASTFPLHSLPSTKRSREAVTRSLHPFKLSSVSRLRYLRSNLRREVQVY